ncbi:unnamed protein product [Adineta ricciae]|uniref:MARVEL domain-containing protein n=1 Tax=Adineta ricciae TaxID=249248 RepID=A0A813T6Q4_ADIRI|nr:unnamed protein product [Adineta ricciae]
MAISGRILFVAGIAITAVSALFCIIGLATKGWRNEQIGGGGIFCNGDGCNRAPAALSIISFILLIVTVVALILQMLDILRGILRYVPTLILFVATFFLLAAFTSYFKDIVGYSFNLMVVAHFFSYVALTVMAYWLGLTDASSN